MVTLRVRNVAAWVGAAGLLWAFAPDTLAQSRRQRSLSSPTLRIIGQGTSVRRFQDYSYGLGALRPRGVLASGSDLLRSSVIKRNTNIARNRAPLNVSMLGAVAPSNSGTSMLSRSRRIGPAPAGGLDLRVGALASGAPVVPVAPTGTSLAPLPRPPGAIDEEEGPGIGRALAEQDETALGAARAYVQALEEAFVSQLKDRSKPITSLIPNRPGPYRDHMAEGDRSFRANAFHKAYTEFLIANDLGGRDAESFVCLTHAQFALSKYSYGKAAYFLMQGLKYMPELPLANLRPRGFYGAESKYAENLVALEEHVERNPTDGEAMLLLAYFRWFSKARDVSAAQKALSSALESAARRNDTRLAEAIETFWRGILQTGLASGDLRSSPGTPPSPGPAAPTGPGAAKPSKKEGP